MRYGQVRNRLSTRNELSLVTILTNIGFRMVSSAIDRHRLALLVSDRQLVGHGLPALSYEPIPVRICHLSFAICHFIRA
jgi:hypothetical protein